MKKRYLLLGCHALFFCVFLAGCGPFAEKSVIVDKGVSDGTVYRGEKTRLALVIPQGWTIQEISNKTSDRLRFTAPLTAAGAVVQIDRFKAKTQEPDGAVAWTVFRTIKFGTLADAKMEFLNEGLSQLCGFQVYGADLKNETSTGKVLCFYKNGHQYTVTYFVARIPRSNELNATIKGSLRTLEFQ